MKLLDAITAVFDRVPTNQAQRMVYAWGQPKPLGRTALAPRVPLEVVGKHLCRDHRGKPYNVPLKYQSPVEPKPRERLWSGWRHHGLQYA